MKISFLFILVLGLSFSSFSKGDLEALFKKNYQTETERENLKKRALEKGGESVPLLMKVMKTSSYPDDNRWLATYALGEIMGVKSAPFISKFVKHPKWFMRLAALKTLLVLKLKEDKYQKLYAQGLKDPSMIVRTQALDNITSLKIKSLAPNIWAMLYDESNYEGSKKHLKRGQMIKDIILALGHLDLKKAKPALMKMITSKKYQDIFLELDYALNKLTGEKSPKHHGAKKIYWTKKSLAHKNSH